MKDKWRNYALKDGKVKSSYICEHCDRSPKRKTCEASSCNSVFESRQEPKLEEEVRDIFGSTTNLMLKTNLKIHECTFKTNPVILNDAWVQNLRGQDGNAQFNEERSRIDETCERDILAVRTFPGEQSDSRGQTRNLQTSRAAIEEKGISKSLNEEPKLNGQESSHSEGKAGTRKRSKKGS
jgi:hypothetical protein